MRFVFGRAFCGYGGIGMKKWIALLVLGLCLLFAVSALGDEAADITEQCKFKAGSGRSTFHEAHDRSYKTYWKSSGGESAYIEVTVPEGECATGVMTKWFDKPQCWQLQVKDESGEWVTCAQSEGLYYNEYLSLPENTTFFRLTTVKGKNSRLHLTELYIYGKGDLPRAAQQWQPSAEKADMLLVVAHPDDEVLWFGGAMPLYAGQYNMKVQVAMMVPTMPYRRIELLDCLWTCGVKNYPVWANFADSYSSKLSEMYTRWKPERVNKYIVGWIRRFKPDVLLTHDLRGEYGHAAHKVCADACINCLEFAADESKYPDSAAEFGTWDVPKTYLHLYEENVVDMDWRKPLPAFDGLTGFEVAEDAFECHISQQNTDYHVEDWGPYDCSLFGLVRSLVGEDVNKNDFFENLPTAPVTE